MVDHGGPTPVVQPAKPVEVAKPVALVKCDVGEVNCPSKPMTPDAATKEGWFQSPEGKWVCRQHNAHVHRIG